MVKTMERFVDELLMYYLETEDFLVHEEAGLWQFRGTDDQATYLSQELEDAFQEQSISWP